MLPEDELRDSNKPRPRLASLELMQNPFKVETKARKGKKGKKK